MRCNTTHNSLFVTCYQHDNIGFVAFVQWNEGTALKEKRALVSRTRKTANNVFVLWRIVPEVVWTDPAFLF
jgi:hypothetical protein